VPWLGKKVRNRGSEDIVSFIGHSVCPYGSASVPEIHTNRWEWIDDLVRRMSIVIDQDDKFSSLSLFFSDSYRLLLQSNLEVAKFVWECYSIIAPS
jgi:hypothetical protein